MGGMRSIIKTKIRWSLPLDIYTAEKLPFAHRSIEHVIPQSILKKYAYDYSYRPSTLIQDPLNLFTTSPMMNSFRSNYKYASLLSPSPIDIDKASFPSSLKSSLNNIKKEKKEEEEDDENYTLRKKMSIYRDSRNGIFYVTMNQRILAHTILNMYRKYRRLEEYHSDIFHQENLLELWLKIPWTVREKNMLQSKWLLFGETSF
jgi:hypothetical protein